MIVSIEGVTTFEMEYTLADNGVFLMDGGLDSSQSDPLLLLEEGEIVLNNPYFENVNI